MVDTTAGIGEALALGTQATPYKGTPITDSAQLYVKGELARQLKQAESDAAAKKQLEMLSKAKTYKLANVMPIFQSTIRAIGDKAVNEMGMSTHMQGVLTAKQMADEEVAPVIAANENIKILRTKAVNPNILTPDKIRGVVTASTEKEAKKRAAEYDTIDGIRDLGHAGMEETTWGFKLPYSYSDVPKYDMVRKIDEWNRQLVNSESPRMKGFVSGDPQNKLYVQKAPEGVIREYAADIVNSDANVIDNVLNQYDKEWRKIAENAIKADPTIAEDFNKQSSLRVIAATKLLGDQMVDNARAKYTTKGVPTDKKYSSATKTAIESVGVQNANPTALKSINKDFSDEGESFDFTIKKSAGATDIYDPQTGVKESVTVTGFVRDGKGNYWIKAIAPKFQSGKYVADVGGVQFNKLIPLTSENFASLKSAAALSEGDAFVEAVNDAIQSQGLGFTFSSKPFSAKKGPATQAPPKKKRVSMSTIKEKVGTKGFEGYTEKELADYYGSQGYEIV